MKHRLVLIIGVVLLFTAPAFAQTAAGQGPAADPGPVKTAPPDFGRTDPAKPLPPGFMGADPSKPLPPPFKGADPSKPLPPGFMGADPSKPLPPAFKEVDRSKPLPPGFKQPDAARPHSAGARETGIEKIPGEKETMEKPLPAKIKDRKDTRRFRKEPEGKEGK